MHFVPSMIALLLAVVLAAPAVAQQRAPAFGLVVDSRGQPITAAEVTLVHTPMVGAMGNSDVVACQTDARGRFVARLRVGDHYSAWAIGGIDGETGQRQVSEPIDYVASGQLLELRCKHLQTKRVVQLRAVGAWLERGGDSLLWIPDSRHSHGVKLAIPDDRELVLPWSPHIEGVLAIADTRGDVLVLHEVGIGDQTDVAAFRGPMDVEVLVIDKLGNPVEGVAVDALVPLRVASERDVSPFESIERGPLSRRLCVTGKDGVGTGFVPEPTTRFYRNSVHRKLVVLRVAHPGFGLAYAAATKPDEQVRIQLEEAREMRVSVFPLPESRQAHLALVGKYSVAASTGTRKSGNAALPIERVGDGEFRVSSMQPFESLQSYLVLDAQKGQPPVCVPMLESVAADHWSIDLRARHKCQVQVLGVDGAPAGGVVVGVAKAGDSFPVRWLGKMTADPAGRVTVLLPDAKCVVYAFVGLEHGLVILDGESDRALLRMESIPTMRIELVDLAGVPQIGAKVESTDFEYGRDPGTGESFQWWRMSASRARALVGSVRSDSRGVVSVPVFVRPRGKMLAQFSCGDIASEEVKLVGGSKARLTMRQ